jgi:hypothetical protein
MAAVGLIGFIVTFPMWLLGMIDDHAMIGLTLALSWLALWFSAFVSVQERQHANALKKE